MVLFLRSKASIPDLGCRFGGMEKETVSLITWMSPDRKGGGAARREIREPLGNSPRGLLNSSELKHQDKCQ